MVFFVLALDIVILVLAWYCSSLEDRISDISHIVGGNRKEVVGRVRELNVNLKWANRRNERLEAKLETDKALRLQWRDLYEKTQKGLKVLLDGEHGHRSDCGCETVKRVFGPDAASLECNNRNLKRVNDDD